jgi:hypothetical protein
MLHIAVFSDLALQLLLALHQLLGLVVQFLLHLVERGIKAGDGLFQIKVFLVFRQKISLVVSNVVLKDGIVRYLISLFLRSCLQSLDQFLFVLIQVFYQRLEPLYLQR